MTGKSGMYEAFVIATKVSFTRCSLARATGALTRIDDLRGNNYSPSWAGLLKNPLFQSSIFTLDNTPTVALISTAVSYQAID